MAEKAIKSVMRRMARIGRQEYSARTMSPAKALRLSLARAADKLFDLPLTVTAIEQDDISHADLAAELGEGGLLVPLDGAVGEGGAMRLDPGLLTALVEMQTTGHVSGQCDATRRVTRTDAAMAAPLIDGTLERIDACMTAESSEEWVGGYRFGVMIEDARALALSLSAPDYTVFCVLLEISAEACPGALTMILPFVAPAPPQTAASGAGAVPPDTTLARAVLDAPVALRAVLGRITMPLDKLCALKVADRLPFSRVQLLDARLEVGQKQLVAHARLGQMNGARAVRLALPDGVAAGASCDQQGPGVAVMDPAQQPPRALVRDAVATAKRGGAKSPLPANKPEAGAAQGTKKLAKNATDPGDQTQTGGADPAALTPDLMMAEATQKKG